MSRLVEAARALVKAHRAKKSPKELNRLLEDLDEAVKATDEAFDELLVEVARDEWEVDGLEIDERPVVSIGEDGSDEGLVAGWVQAWVFAHYRKD